MVPNAVVHVPSEDELLIFSDFCTRYNLRWNNGSNFASHDEWEDYRGNTVYFIYEEEIQYSCVEFAKGDYLTAKCYEKERPEDPRLFLCSVYDLIQIVEGGEDSDSDFDSSLLDDLL